MGADRHLDLACFSYLADVQLLHVDAYPRANGGAIIEQAATSVAGDGPLTALTAAGLGLRTALISNRVGADTAGRALLDGLDAAGVRHDLHPDPGRRTPNLTVVADRDTRTWFASLADAVADLDTADLTPLTDARLAYVDCYRAVTAAAARAVRAAGDTPLLLNLGGDPLEDRIVAAARSARLCAVQTNLDETDARHAEAVALRLFDRLRPDAAIVTLGRLGALAATRDGVHRAAAAPAVVLHTHGGGAAFSAGYAHAVLTGADIPAAVRAGCDAGTAHCVSTAAQSPRRLPDAVFATA
jgi:sugar/nucleoside kinase (ribokinase family)